MKQDLDISNIQPKRKRVEQHKYDAVMADLRETSRYADGLFQKLEQAVDERDRLKAENGKIKSSLSNTHNTSVYWHSQYEQCAEERSMIRDQRDMARFIAALLLIVSVGFAVAVWIGKLVPNVNLD